MTIYRRTWPVTVAAVCLATISVSAQGRGPRSGVQGATVAPPPAARVADDPLQGPLVTNAPFSAEGVTTVTQVLGDGTRIEQSSRARFYRDSAGRVRSEQSILGLAALAPAGQQRQTITISDVDGSSFTLDPATRTARRGNLVAVRLNGVPVSARQGPNGGFIITGGEPGERRVTRMDAQADPDAVPQAEESLGTRQIEGITAVGRRRKSIIPAGKIGNDRPIEIVDERWESPDLRLLIRSHHRDPRTGDIEYRLTNIVRAEQPPDLFTVPSDYTVGVVGGVVGGTRSGGAGNSGAGRRSGGPAN